MIKAIVSDIEGTTSSISFVKEVLFPYAAKHLPDFLQQHWQDSDVQQHILAISDLTGTPVSSVDEANRILQQWISEDRKATPLKSLQGMIWKAGYESGAYTAHLYPDTAPALRQWHAQGLPLFIYSSGSIAAQKLFFRYSDAGDLTPLLSDYFDTTTGAKQDIASYEKIAAHIGMPAENILFLSDIEAELNAARAAGMQTILLDREQQAPNSEHPVVSAFSEIVI